MVPYDRLELLTSRRPAAHADCSLIRVCHGPDGHGSFTAATGGPAGGNAATVSIFFGDFDRDGDVDLFVGNDGADELWLNDG